MDENMNPTSFCCPSTRRGHAHACFRNLAICLGLALFHSNFTELASAQQVTFAQQPMADGQKIWQHVTLFANTMTTYEQEGQKISRTHRYVTKEQIRRLTVLDARPGTYNKILVSYEKAQETRTPQGKSSRVLPQAVAGKKYIVSRPDGDLVVLDEDGQPAAEEEARIVRDNMQSVGRPNPLAVFLDGRTLRIGQAVELPPEVASDLLGWQENYGPAQQVTITLKEVKEQSGGLIAALETAIVGTPVSGLSSQTSMNGQLLIEVATCRTLSTNLKANLAVHETRGPEGHTFTVSHEGQANIHTQARYLR